MYKSRQRVDDTCIYNVAESERRPVILIRPVRVRLRLSVVPMAYSNGYPAFILMKTTNGGGYNSVQRRRVKTRYRDTTTGPLRTATLTFVFHHHRATTLPRHCGPYSPFIHLNYSITAEDGCSH